MHRLILVRLGALVLLCGALVLSVASITNAQTGKLLGGKQTDYPDWFKASFLDINEDILEAGKNGKLLMVLFVLNNCPYCHALVERNMSQQSIKDTLQSKFDIVLINIRGDQEVTFVDEKSYTEKALSAALGVQFTPTLLFFDPHSNTPYEPVMRLNGYIPPSQFSEALSYLTSNRSLSFPEYRATRASERGLVNKDTKNPLFLQPITRLRTTLGKPFALFFTQPDCPDCQAMYQKIHNHSSLGQVIQDLPSHQINIWSNTQIELLDGSKTTARAYAEKMNIQYAPTIAVFDENGAEIIRALWLESFHLESMLRYALTKSYKDMGFQAFLTQRSQATREAGEDVHLWDNK